MRAWLQLVRLPAVFTALADIFLGFLLNHRSFGEAPREFVALLASSAALYMAGMVFNDVFDRRLDAVERPERPIPSGRVSVQAAVLLGGLLLAGGLAAAAFVGLQSLYIAAALTLCILAYDGLLKPTLLGPIAMGGCRFLNVMLGASAHDRALFVWGAQSWWVAAGLGVYIVGVTWFARREAAVSSRWQLLGAMGVVNVGYAALVAYVVGTPGATDSFAVLVVLAAIVLITNRRLTAVAFDPKPAKVQGAVKMLLLSLVVLDATLVLFKTGDPMLAVATAALLVPAVLLGRWMSMT